MREDHRVPFEEGAPYYQIRLEFRVWGPGEDVHVALTPPSNHRPGRVLIKLDCGMIADALDLNHWTGAAFGHIWRAGRKPGETKKEALENALMCIRRELQRLSLLEEAGG